MNPIASDEDLFESECNALAPVHLFAASDKVQDPPPSGASPASEGIDWSRLRARGGNAQGD